MLAALLQGEIATISELQELLLQEYAALKERDLAKLNQVTAEKQACAQRFEALFVKQADCLVQREGRADAAALRAFIASSPLSERLHLEVLWLTLEQALAQVKRQNGINGATIAASRGNAERALAILRGRDPQNGVYSQAAQMSFGGHSRTLAKA